MFTGPSPVQKISMNSPAITGLEETVGNIPTGAANTPPVPEIKIAPCPNPCALVANRPGPKLARLTVSALLVTLCTVSVSEACACPVNSQGT